MQKLGKHDKTGKQGRVQSKAFDLLKTETNWRCSLAKKYNLHPFTGYHCRKGEAVTPLTPNPIRVDQFLLMILSKIRSATSTARAAFWAVAFGVRL